MQDLNSEVVVVVVVVAVVVAVVGNKYFGLQCLRLELRRTFVFVAVLNCDHLNVGCSIFLISTFISALDQLHHGSTCGKNTMKKDNNGMLKKFYTVITEA